MGELIPNRRFSRNHRLEKLVFQLERLLANLYFPLKAKESSLK
jgi:hypothetical protein